MKLFLLITSLFISYASLAQSITANFSATLKIVCTGPTSVKFTDLSINPDMWKWYFGDGSTSTAKNPTHTYTTDGIFAVRLVVQDTIYGITSTFRDTIRISTQTPNINTPSQTVCLPNYVSFVDGSVSSAGILSRLWDFGDGQTSILKNPNNTYSNLGSYTISLTITDNFGCSTVQTKTNLVQVKGFKVDFSAANTITCINSLTSFSDETVYNSPPDSWIWNFGDGTTSSNLQNPLHTYTSSGNYTVTLTATDEDGCINTTTKTNYINSVEITPTITIDNPVSCPGGNDGAATITATGGMGINYDVSWSNAEVTASISGLTSGSYIGSIFDNNGSGCFATTSVIIPVVDLDLPIISCPTDVTINMDAGLCTSTASIGVATATDNCTATPIITNDAPTSFPAGNTTVTWTAKDAVGSTSTCTQIVTVTDSEKPIISCPADITIHTDAGQCTSTESIGLATATDNCTATPIITNDAPTSFPAGNTTVTWTAKDAVGSTSTCTQIVTVTDSEKPIISCPADITIHTDAGQCTSTASIGIATATDNCTVIITNDAPTAFPTGNTTVTWTAKDGAGNANTCTQIVTVTDIEKPAISCPVDITIHTDAGQCTSTASIGIATATDNCTVIITNDAPTAFPTGNTTVTWTAKDGAGNTNTCTQIVTVTDSEKPAISCPADITIHTDAGQCTSTASIGIATATDNCTAAPIITSDAPTSFPIGNTTVTWSAEDAVGNLNICTQIVTVVDNEKPLISCPANITAYGDSTCQFVITDYTDLAIPTDNCTASPIVMQNLVAGTSLNGTGNYAIILSATDATGNSNTCAFDIIIIDTLPPIVTCIGNQSEVLDQNCQYIMADYSIITPFSDNCSNNVHITQIPAAGTIYGGLQNLPITLTFEDASGNSTSCSFILDVKTNEINPGCLDDIVIATLITPNGDGKNDTWIIRDIDFIKECTVQVFNRWGQLVFETVNYQNDWGGRFNNEKLPDGDYYYIIKCNHEIKYSGPLTIVNSL